jgi:hypothetical protein
MTVKELIDALQLLPPDFRVAATAGGHWYEINSIAFVENTNPRGIQRRALVDTLGECVVELQP